ncbi:ATP-binding protein [Virgibacillus ndiopensis]|uniref:ATP-binding protein n=1 Tax=Virgibacillus ndiopensis TaxID=2004408 RepID=UPI000C0735AB|nr:sensor histidine kinase [Virgibacillus ndiopensis]
MFLRKMPIRLKIMILSFGIVLFTLLIGGIILIGNIYQGKENQLGDRGLMTGRIVANLPEIKESVVQSEGWKVINPIVERIRTINQVDYIVVLNMNRIRFSHPIASRLGTISSGKDEGAAFAEHSYVSKAKGEQGTAVRSFVPIMNEEFEQIGVVIVGNMLPSLLTILSSFQVEIIAIALLTLVFGMIGSYLLARHVKQQTFFMEPYEMARVLKERTTVFQAMHEGVIAVDRDERLVVFNEKAKEILNIEIEVNGEQLETILNDSVVAKQLRKKTAVYNETIRVGEKLIVLNRIPIELENELIGCVVIFQDRTDVTKMAEELTGVKAFVDALRLQNHEHMNKLHTIAGLIQLEENDKALEYVFDTTKNQEEMMKFILDRIKNYSIAGLFISKIRRGEELGIDVWIHNNSRLDRFPLMLNHHDFVMILGNLLENAFDAFADFDRKNKRIEVYVFQNKEVCTIQVSDNGKGIVDHTRIFDKGFTTKGGDGSGIGLYLIKQIVTKAGGTIDVQSRLNKGTQFFLQLPMTLEGEHIDEKRSANKSAVN